MQNQKIATRLVKNKPQTNIKTLEGDFAKNRSYYNTLCRYKKDTTGRTIMKGC